MFYLQELRDTGKHICHPEILLLFPQLMHSHPSPFPASICILEKQHELETATKPSGTA